MTQRRGSRQLARGLCRFELLGFDEAGIAEYRNGAGFFHSD
jgi:hypothetical protein